MDLSAIICQYKGRNHWSVLKRNQMLIFLEIVKNKLTKAICYKEKKKHFEKSHVPSVNRRFNERNISTSKNVS